MGRWIVEQQGPQILKAFEARKFLVGESRVLDLDSIGITGADRGALDEQRWLGRRGRGRDRRTSGD